jgi:hypothetical protein
MVTIKEGFDGEPTEIRVEALWDGGDEPRPRTANIEITHTGIPQYEDLVKSLPIDKNGYVQIGNIKHKVTAKNIADLLVTETQYGERLFMFRMQDAIPQRDTTAVYISLDELLDLRDEINEVIRKIVG